MCKESGNWLIGLLLAALVAILPAASSAADKKEILLGTPMPITGILSEAGIEGVWAYEQAIKDVNAKGGIFVKEYNKKLPVRLIVADAESDPGKAAAALERLVKVNKVDLLLSSFTANLVMPTSVAAEKLKVYYHANTCFPVLWRPQHFKWSTLMFFRLDAGAEVPFKTLDTVPAAERPKNLALLMEDTTDGRGFMGDRSRQGADFKENGRVEACYPPFFLDDFFTAWPGQGAGLTPKANDLEAAIKASGLDLHSGQQSGGVLIMGIRAVELNLHDGTHWIALPMICDKAATFGSMSAMADRTSRRSAFNVKIRCRIHRKTFTG